MTLPTTRIRSALGAGLCHCAIVSFVLIRLLDHAKHPVIKLNSAMPIMTPLHKK